LSQAASDLEARLSRSLENNLAGRLPDAATLAAAEARARHWLSPHEGPLKPGSPEHKSATCRMFADTFNPYKPSVIPWPKLSPEALARITSLPIWDIAVQTEGRARLRMAAYAETLSDPELREAIARNGWEENRHKEVLARLVAAYGIALAPEPAYVAPRDAEWAYLKTGFAECIDSFFAFGLFEAARRSGFFPPELTDTFEPVIQEECRHILLFANWLAWHRANLPLHRRILFELRVVAVWVALAVERAGLARTLGGRPPPKDDKNFTITSAEALSAEAMTFRDLIDLCLAENDRRFAGYDARLLRPTTMPAIARLLRRFLRAPKRAAG
jgi:hypothetical protein